MNFLDQNKETKSKNSRRSRSLTRAPLTVEQWRTGNQTQLETATLRPDEEFETQSLPDLGEKENLEEAFELGRTLYSAK